MIIRDAYDDPALLFSYADGEVRIQKPGYKTETIAEYGGLLLLRLVIITSEGGKTRERRRFWICEPDFSTMRVKPIFIARGVRSSWGGKEDVDALVRALEAIKTRKEWKREREQTARALATVEKLIEDEQLADR